MLAGDADVTAVLCTTPTASAKSADEAAEQSRGGAHLIRGQTCSDGLTALSVETIKTDARGREGSHGRGQGMTVVDVDVVAASSMPPHHVYEQYFDKV